MRARFRKGAQSRPRPTFREKGNKLMFIFYIISLWLRDVVLLKIGFSTDFLSNRDLIPIVSKLADSWSMDNVLDKLKFLEKAWYEAFRGNINKQIMLENLVLKITE